jgi:putative sigma-54 modulation protein
MNVEYTGRHYEISSNIRKEVESGIGKIRKILGDRFETKVILAVEKHRHKAEITITPRKGPIVGVAQANDMLAAVSEALEHLEKQALKYKTRWRSKKQKARKKFNGLGEGEAVETAGPPPRREASVSLTVHRFPAVAKTTEVHLVPARDSVALRPMTLEEAIKEAHFRDRDVFVFRDPKGKLMVLHRTKDGKMELIEAP